jgi:phage terminase large subunit-like protein
VNAASHFAEFCASLTQSEDRWEGEPFTLEPWQRRFWREALRDWRSVVLIVPRKNGKTTMLAALALYELVYGKGRPEILLAAASDRQAGRLFDAAARFVRRHPGLRELLRVRDHEGTIVREDGLGSIIRLRSDPNRLYGYSPTLVIADELAFWSTPTLKRSYAALTSGGGARSAPRTFTITTAGEASQRHDSILGAILDAAVEAPDVTRKPGLTISRMHAARTLVYAFEAPTTDVHDVKALKLANPSSWITLDYLQRQVDNPELTDAQVLQLHGCVWAESSDTWIGPAAWAACVEPGRVIEPGEPVVLGFDGSASRDSTALVACTLDGFVQVVRVWERPERAREWRVPRQEVADVIARMIDTHEVRELACDPPGWGGEIELWAELYGEIVVEFPTSSRERMARACDRLRADVLERRLRHDGSEVLARHVGHAVARATPYGTTIGKSHVDSPRKIDAAVAAVVAYERAMWHAGNAPEPVQVMVAWGR